MSLGKHIGRKVAGVGVGVAMLVLGLQAPAMAASAVTAVAPTSGPADCVVVVTGSGFKTFPDSSNTLTFVGPVSGAIDDVDAADWFTISDTEIWAVVPTLVAGTSYTVVLTQPSGTNTAGGTFLSTGAAGGAAGGCAPTITSFAPTCSTAGNVVTITGTNLLDASNLLGTNSGGDVSFQDTTPPSMALATQPVPDLSSPTSISAIVPTGVADGPILVETDVDANPASLGIQGVFSTTSFLTPPPDCVPVGGTTHARSVSFKIKSTGKASGKVSSTEDPAFTECVAAVPVKIQRKTSSGWKTVGKTTTSDTGSYAKKVKNPKGKQKFRALAPKVSLGDPVTDVCSKAKSATRKV
jgi:IPT/TIG domain-containing protein